MIRMLWILRTSNMLPRKVIPSKGGFNSSNSILHALAAGKPTIPNNSPTNSPDMS
jgi:hypothetical protein